MINFKVQNLAQNIQKTINAAQENIAQASAGTTWNEVFNPIDEVLDTLNKQSSVNAHLNAVHFSEEFNAEYEETLPLLSDFYSELSTNKALFQAYQQLLQTNLDREECYILTQTLRDFELSGVNLPTDKQEVFKQLSSELSLLANTFAKNSLRATNEYSYEVSEAELTGLSAQDKAKLLKESKYYLSLQAPDYIAVMSFCTNEAVRKRLYHAYMARASEKDGFDNLATMHSILEKRQQLAQLLGFENYAEYSLASKMVQKPDKVEAFILELITKSRPQAEEELRILSEFAGRQLQPWDISYYSEQYKKQHFGIDKQKLKEYFPFEKVLTGLLDTIAQLYQLQYKIIPTIHYGQELATIIFKDQERVIGEVLFDGFARKNKRSGAWMADYQGLNASKQQYPIAFVVCNASAPTTDTPSLFDFDDVVTLFHEFGHALHHILTTTSHPSVAGINGVPWDGVELPSQYMEFFAYEIEVIQRISAHYQTGEALPEELLQRIIDVKNFNAALATLRQCEFALWDIRTHSSTQDTYAILKEVQEQTTLLPVISDNYFLNSFGHIFAGGYAAGYYSYKWAEVMAADAYHIVSKNRSKAADFRKYILASGGSADFLESYLQFSGGKQPNIDALLTLSNIKY